MRPLETGNYYLKGPYGRMKDDQEKLNALLDRVMQPGSPPLSEAERQWLEEFTRQYPFFTIPEILKTPQRGEDASLREIVSGPAPEARARLRGEPEASRFDSFYPSSPAPKAPSTNDAIADFLNTYGHQSPEEDELLERLIFNPIPDYSQQLARQEEASLPPSPPPEGDSPEDRLNRFILSHRQELSTPSVSASRSTGEVETAPSSVPSSRKVPTAPPEGLLSESLAKIYIKTRRYEQAYEILNGLSLRFPEKSAYFADQLRFLRKLIINQQRLRLENQK